MYLYVSLLLNFSVALLEIEMVRVCLCFVNVVGLYFVYVINSGNLL